MKLSIMIYLTKKRVILKYAGTDGLNTFELTKELHP